APEIFLMRDMGCTSTSPNLAKSTLGQGSRFSSPPLLATAAGADALPIAPVSTPLIQACTSSLVMRFLGPVPGMRLMSAPSSRANWRTDGLAWAWPPLLLASSAGVGMRTAAGAVVGSSSVGRVISPATKAAAAGLAATGAAGAGAPARLTTGGGVSRLATLAAGEAGLAGAAGAGADAAAGAGAAGAAVSAAAASSRRTTLPSLIAS